MSDKKPIVLVDMDGVLADLDGELLRRFRERYSELPYVPLAARKKFYAEEEFPPESQTAVRAIMCESGFFFDLPPVVGALEAMKIFAKRAEVFICTAPLLSNDSCISDKARWVKKHLGPEWLRRLIITKDKTLVRGDYLIDDKPKITGLLAPIWEHIIFDAPYNRGVRDKKRLGWSWWSWQRVLFDPNYESYKDHASPDFDPDRISMDAVGQALDLVIEWKKREGK